MARIRKSADRNSSRPRRPSRRRRTDGNMTDVNQDRPKRRNPKSPELPPNENLNKHPDEAYGDTEIPERREDF